MDVLTLDDLWTIGFGWAFTGIGDAARMLATLRRELGRPLAGWEEGALRDGFAVGAEDARAYREDMERRADVAAGADEAVPF